MDWLCPIRTIRRWGTELQPVSRRAVVIKIVRRRKLSKKCLWYIRFIDDLQPPFVKIWLDGFSIQYLYIFQFFAGKKRKIIGMRGQKILRKGRQKKPHPLAGKLLDGTFDDKEYEL